MALLYTAKKYDIQLLLDRCIAFLTRTLDIENIWMIMDHALKFDERRLVDNCYAFIKRNTSIVLQCQKLLDLPKSTMKIILLEAFERVNPLVCYNVVKKWAHNQLGVSARNTVKPDMIRETVDDLLTAVRCSGMPLNTFMHLSIFCPPGGAAGIHGALDRRPFLTGGNLINLWNPGPG